MVDAFPKPSHIEGIKPNILRIRSRHSRARPGLGRMQSKQTFTYQEMMLSYSRTSVTVTSKLDVEADTFYRTPISSVALATRGGSLIATGST
jgi:hypothetical protein